ncbi:MAG: MBL fold metallo-hydrolase, partial [Sedimenticola sp.]
YVLEIGGGKIYFGGDSGYADHYLQTYERFGPMDLSLIPVGGYAPRDFMGFAHLDPGQAVQAHLDLRSRKSIGIHFGTFQLTQEPIDEPTELLAKARESAGLKEGEFVTLEFGQPLVIPGDPAGTGRQGE